MVVRKNLIKPCRKCKKEISGQVFNCSNCGVPDSGWLYGEND
jgi:hypothetical protein